MASGRAFLYKYRVDSFIVQVDGLSNAFPASYDQIESIIIEKDYENLMLPLFLVELWVPNYVYRAMTKQDAHTYVTVDMKMGSADEGLKLEEINKATFKSFIKDKFYALITNKSPQVLDTYVEKHEQTTDVYGVGAEYRDMVMVKMLLYKYSHWKSLSKVVNNVITSCTLIDALLYVINVSGLSNVLLSPPNNSKTYKEFIITPISPMEQIDRICNEYGFHNSGTVVFFDFDYIYIVNKSPECTAYVPNEYKTTYLMSNSVNNVSSTMTGGCVADANTKSYALNIIGETINIEDLTEANNQIYGNNFTIIDTKSGSVKNVRSNTGASSVGQVVMINKGDDTSDAAKSRISEAKTIMRLGFSHIDLNMLAVNKCFITSFQDSRFAKYNKKVRLCKMTCMFSKEGGYFTPLVTCEFRG